MTKENLFDDWSGRLWILHDDAVWKTLHTQAGITANLDQARRDLDRILYSSPLRSAIQNGEAKKIIKTLAKKVQELAKITREKIEQHDLIWVALRNAGMDASGKQIDGRDIECDLDAHLSNLLLLHMWLDVAGHKIPKGKSGRKGKSDEKQLSEFVKKIYAWHVKHGGGGLVRASEVSKRGGRATSHKNFVTTIIKLAGIPHTLQ